MARTFLLLLLPLAGIGGAPALGQVIEPNVARGPFAALACGISLDENFRSSSTDLVLLKSPLDQTSTPPSFTRPSTHVNRADYSLAEMFSYTDIEIDAHSTGNDVVPEPDENGVPDLVTIARWMGVTISLTNDSPGNGNLLVTNRTGQMETPGGDLMTYFMEASTGITTNLPGATILDQAREHIGFSGAGDSEIDATDWAMGVLATSSQNLINRLFFRETNAYFFSVTWQWAWANRTNLNFATDRTINPGGVPVAANAATVYMIRWQWNAVDGWHWSDPDVYRSALQLGLTGEYEDLDALAVDTSPRRTILFSTKRVTGRSQILIHQMLGSTSVGPYPLSEDDTRSVTAELGLDDDDDDVNSICSTDPEPGEVDYDLAVPIDVWPSPAAAMGISVVRGYQRGTTVEEVLIECSGGLDAGGYAILALSGNYPPWNPYPNPLDPYYNWLYLGPQLHFVRTGGAHATPTARFNYQISGQAGVDVAAAVLLYDTAFRFRTASWITFLRL